MDHAESSPVSTRRAMQALLPGLTLARVLAMGTILVGHSLVSYTYFRDRVLIWPVYEADGWLPLDAYSLPVRGVALPLFFILAGISAGLATTTMSPLRFFYGRWKTVGVPLIVAMLTIFPITGAIYLYGLQVTEQANMTPSQRELIESLDKSPLWWGPMHLWFLEFLLLISCGYASVLWASRRFARFGQMVNALRDAVVRMLNSRWRTLGLAAPLLAMFLVDLRPWDVLLHTFLPHPTTLVYYAAFFALGVCITRLANPRETLGRSCWLELVIAIVSFEVLWPLCCHHFHQPLAGTWRILLMVAIAFSTAASLLALLGLCVRYARRVGPVTEYLAQTSFWIYLVHVPLVMLLQAELWRCRLPTPLKFFLVAGGSLGLSLFLYEVLVRPGWLGKLLQGKQAAPEHRYAQLTRRTAGFGLATALVALLGYGGWLYSHHNFHAVSDKHVYRSARLPAKRLEQLIADEQLRHVMVVCDPLGHDWFTEQQHVCEQHAVAMHVVALPSNEPPSPAALAALVSTLQQMDGPILIEAKNGTDREAVAAAVAQLLAGKSPAEARRQFSWRYGYFHAHAVKGPHIFINAYEEWLAANQRWHSPEEFAAWVAQNNAAEGSPATGPLARATSDDSSNRR